MVNLLVITSGSAAKSPLKSPEVKLDPNMEYIDVEEFYVKYKN